MSAPLIDYFADLYRVVPITCFSWERHPERAVRALGAEIHDPLWTLHRQWQMGEFKGEDAAAPCSVTISKRERPLKQWWPGATASATTGGAAIDPGKQVVEAALTGEPLPLDVRARVELGRLLLTMIATYSARFSRPLAGEFPLETPLSDDPAARMVARVSATVPDGGKVLQAVRQDAAGLAAQLQALQSSRTLVPWSSLLSAFAADAARLLGCDAGGVGAPTDPARPSASPSWDTSALDHRLAVATEGASGVRVELAVDPDADGALDWFAFDRIINPDEAWRDISGEEIRRIPGRVKLPGMPSARWWDFEDSAASLLTLDLSLGDSEEDARNHRSAQLAWLRFQLVQGNDWYMLAIPAKVGHLCRIDTVKVVDVFGLEHTIQPPEQVTGARRWSMFRNGALPYSQRTLVVAPTTDALHEVGVPIEALRFARDEQANLVWAIPSVLPDGLGRGRRVEREVVERLDERDIFRSEAQPASFRYLPRTQVPRSWIPFLPMKIRPGSEAIRLQRGAVAGADGRRHTADPPPMLATARGEALYIREESVPRGGVRVFRQPVRARDLNGDVHVWIRRGSEAGTGEASSGLRFDLAVNDTPKD